MEHIKELERVAALGLPEWSEEATDQTDPILADLERRLVDDRALREEVVDYIRRNSGPVASSLRLLFSPGLFPTDRSRDGAVNCAGIRAPAESAVFLAQDTISVPERKLRKEKAPWNLPSGSWFFGSPQGSTVSDSWPRGEDDKPLDFLLQVDLSKVSAETAGFSDVGLPDDLVLQLFVDLEVAVGVMNHQVVAFAPQHSHKKPLKPPRGSDVHQANPRLINPVGALTLPAPDAGHVPTDDRQVYELLETHANSFPYDVNNYEDTNEEVDAGPGARHIPMARMGGIPRVDSNVQTDAAQHLDCRVEDLFALFDLPVDPEPHPVQGERSRIAVLIERDRLAQGDFTKSFAVGY